ncbi:hypothetical protein [Rhodopila sp.]|uniref:hypothetical protein n=1 Tax=Rhodopila sp. TaxID=2480087 RepID=UPI003D1417EC
MADKDGVERKVWLLPTELSERIKAFQASQGIASEVEAARRLLDSALQMRDAVPDILRKLRDRYEEEKDLRVLARDVLVNHALVRSVTFDDDSVWFQFRDETLGRIEKDGKTYTGYRDDRTDLNWASYPKPTDVPARRSRQGGGPSWDAPKGGDLDDEIPF